MHFGSWLIYGRLGTIREFSSIFSSNRFYLKYIHSVTSYSQPWLAFLMDRDESLTRLNNRHWCVEGHRCSLNVVHFLTIMKILAIFVILIILAKSENLTILKIWAKLKYWMAILDIFDILVILVIFFNDLVWIARNFYFKI